MSAGGAEPPPHKQTSTTLDAAVDGRGLRPVFQRIVSLTDDATVGVEALARWAMPVDIRPEDVMNRASACGQLRHLDRVCIEAAIDVALEAGLPKGSALFVNSEATAPHVSPTDNSLLERAADHFQVIIEVTERSLSTDPAALMEKIAGLRSDGFAIALDDVGAYPDSLALLDVVSPDIIKLDLALVRSQPRYQKARTWAAVLAHHERHGALLLAKGIDTAEHLQRAISLGATLGQGVLHGHPGPLDVASLGQGPYAPAIRQPPSFVDMGSPFDIVVASGARTRTERKDTVVALSRYLEQQAIDTPDPPMVLAALQRAEFFSSETRRRYHRLGAVSPLVLIFGVDVAADLGHGVGGVTFDRGDPLTEQWIVLCLGANIASAIVAREDHDDAPHRHWDGERRFRVSLTNDREVVTAVARTLLHRAN